MADSRAVDNVDATAGAMLAWRVGGLAGLGDDGVIKSNWFDFWEGDDHSVLAAIWSALRTSENSFVHRAPAHGVFGASDILTMDHDLAAPAVDESALMRGVPAEHGAIAAVSALAAGQALSSGVFGTDAERPAAMMMLAVHGDLEPSTPAMLHF